ncbi:MAG TPA: aminotransferase class I/II-fold pyridoxal phosphate-dependent enzyme [Bryobacteraceae bacterium]|jgi:8-amino-7-oxononanoate synthase
METTIDQKRAVARELLRGIRQTTAPVAHAEGKSRGLEEIGEEFYRPDQFPAYRNLLAQEEGMRRLGLKNPYFACHTGVSRDTIIIDDRSYINYSGYNYLGLSGDPEVNAAVIEAIECYGTSASASRIVSGDIPLHRELEAELAAFHHVEDAVVFVSGYGTNVSTIGYLFGPRDLLLHDSLIHNSALTGCILSGARRIPFPHNDCAALERLLREHRMSHERVCIITEGVFSMDGDMPDLRHLIELKLKYKALLMVDEAHSAGTIGATGHGIAEYCGVEPAAVDIWMGTLSKSFASCGGYIAGCRALTLNLRYAAPGGILYSVGMSPANAAAALAALHKFARLGDRVQALRRNSQMFTSLAKSEQLDTGPSGESPVVPVIVRNSVHCLKLADRLFKAGINVQPMLYPVVAEEASRLRFFITALHTPEQIRFTVERTAALLREVRGEHN